MADGRFSALSNSSGHPHAAANPGEVREALARILNSQEFRSSHRSKEFLKYVVENTLEGRGETLKERTIGIDVYGRPASYDPADDATVRVKAGEVRKRLDRYYSAEGRASKLRIELPAGTYTPEFRLVGLQAPVTAPVVVAPVAEYHAVRNRWWYVAALIVLIALAVAIVL